MSTRKRRHKGTLEGMSGGIFLIGIGVLFLVDSVPFWPWVLVVIGLASMPGSVARDGLWAGLQSLVWLVGLAILFATDTLWPGVLILIGLSIVAGALFRPPGFEKQKRKRGLPPDDASFDDDML
jgi:hypothetical protein